MKFSLILCTINRTKEVKELLDSLVSQIYKNFEIIIVDQNNDNKIDKLIEKFVCLDIKLLKSEIGLSKARNFGLKYSKGDIVCFPDDDCIYPKELLNNINIFFQKNNYDILTGKTINKETNKIVAGKNKTKSSKLTTFDILGSSTTLFIRKKGFDISFDERFGLGAVFNAEEENELLFRLLKNKIKGYYCPDINYVYHPPSEEDLTNLNRVRKRTIGLGAFIAKHLFSIEGFFYFIKYNLVRPLFASLFYLIKLDLVKSKFYINRFIGIWTGFFKYLRVNNDSNI